MNILVFEDQRVEQLYPITMARPAYAVTCGCLRLEDWVISLQDYAVGTVRPHLRTLQELDFPHCNGQLDPSKTFTLLVNAQIAPCVANFEKLDSIVKRFGGSEEGTEATSVAVDQAGNVCVAIAPTSALASDDLDASIATLFGSLPAKPDTDVVLDVLLYPHDVVRFNQEHFNANLNHLIEQRSFKQLQDGVFVGENCNLSKHVVFDTNDGPVVIDDSATIGPFSYFAGPVYVGPNCKIAEHAAIKDYVCLVHTVKAGGEIEATVIEPYSNKQHHGFLGHSYLGSWINLGAGTCNSDLKNTYGKVNANYHGKKVSTGMQFVGCFIGDYSKSAINTSIFTGKTIGVCSMLYGFVAADVPSFVNYAKTFGQSSQVPADVMVTTQQRMFGRRKVEQRPADIQLIHDMLELTLEDRRSKKIPEGNLSFG